MNGMRGLHDFVRPTGFPLPWNPVTMSGLNDFVPATQPWLFPRGPVAAGSLPKAPPIPRALIGNGGDSGGCGMGCGAGCGCDSCSGMGGLGDTIIPQASLPTFLQGEISGVPTIYLALGVVAAAVLFMGQKRGRR